MKSIYKTGNFYFENIEDAESISTQVDEIIVYEGVNEWYKEFGYDFATNYISNLNQPQYMAIRMYFEKIFK